MVMVCQKIEKIITQCTSKGPAILASPWQITKSSKPYKTLFVNTQGIWENVQRYWEEKKENLKDIKSA
jgi:hypothetical protein